MTENYVNVRLDLLTDRLLFKPGPENMSLKSDTKPKPGPKIKLGQKNVYGKLL